MKKSKIGIIILIIVIVVSVGTFFGVSYYLDKDLEKQEQELQNTKEEYGTVNEENVATLVAKFNTEVMDNGPQYPASDDYSVAENGVYWYALYEDINLLFTGDYNNKNMFFDVNEIPKKIKEIERKTEKT